MKDASGEAITIRQATARDFGDVLRLSVQAWPGWWDKKANAKAGQEHIRARISQGRALVATHKGKVIGHTMFSIMWNILHLEEVIIDPAHRHRGIASSLLEKDIAIARRLGLRKVLSDCDATNTASVHYHVRNGFRLCGYIENLYGRDDAIVFSKELHYGR
jgi:ribosomal protein S18 acetylase RimI-like enzyme